jgi:hypothetical protein
MDQPMKSQHQKDFRLIDSKYMEMSKAMLGILASLTLLIKAWTSLFKEILEEYNTKLRI